MSLVLSFVMCWPAGCALFKSKAAVIFISLSLLDEAHQKHWEEVTRLRLKTPGSGVNGYRVARGQVFAVRG